MRGLVRNPDDAYLKKKKKKKAPAAPRFSQTL